MARWSLPLGNTKEKLATGSPNPRPKPKPDLEAGLQLFDLEQDLQETKNIAKELKLIKMEIYTMVILLMVIKMERSHLHNKIN